MRCENEGASVGNAQCPADATHRVLIRRDDGDYESFLCASCFLGFRAAMIEQGSPPSSEVRSKGS